MSVSSYTLAPRIALINHKHRNLPGSRHEGTPQNTNIGNFLNRAHSDSVKEKQTEFSQGGYEQSVIIKQRHFSVEQIHEKP